MHRLFACELSDLWTKTITCGLSFPGFQTRGLSNGLENSIQLPCNKITCLSYSKQAPGLENNFFYFYFDSVEASSVTVT